MGGSADCSIGEDESGEAWGVRARWSRTWRSGCARRSRRWLKSGENLVRPDLGSYDYEMGFSNGWLEMVRVGPGFGRKWFEALMVSEKG